MSDELRAPEKSKEQPERLSSLSRNPREVHDARAGEGYSLFIRRMKVVLPVLALAIVAALFSWNMFSPDSASFVAPEEEAPRATVGKNELVTPRFDSVDDKGQPYTIVAERALQDTDDELILLENPKAELELKDGKKVQLEALQGAFRQETQRVLLKDNVKMTHDDGYEFNTQELDVDMKAGTAETSLAITGEGPLGTLEARGMQSDKASQALVFTGPAKLVIYDVKAKDGRNILNP